MEFQYLTLDYMEHIYISQDNKLKLKYDRSHLKNQYS